jgi:hypothetical protein
MNHIARPSITPAAMPEAAAPSRPSPAGRYAGLEIHRLASGCRIWRAMDEDAPLGLPNMDISTKIKTKPDYANQEKY